MAKTGAAAVEAAAEEAQRGNYEASFHFLMAALHMADKSSDLALVETISAMADKLGKELDSLKPQHNLSRSAAQLRGQTPLFESLPVHCKAVILRHRPTAA